MWKQERGGQRVARFLPVVVVLLIGVILYSIYVVYNCFPLLQIEVPPEFRDEDARTRGFGHLVVSHVLAVLMFWSLYKACVTPAGSVPETEEWKARPNAEEIVERKRDGTLRYCHKCSHYKPDRTHHSRHTGKCTLKLDHYCPWVANDIGYFNYKFFYLTLLYTTVTLSFAAATMIPTVSAAFTDPNIPFETAYFIIMGTVLSLCVLVIVGSFFIFHSYLLSINSSTVEYCEKRRGGPGLDWDLGVFRNNKEVMVHPWMIFNMWNKKPSDVNSLLRQKLRHPTTEYGFDSGGKKESEVDPLFGVNVDEAKEHGKYSKVRKIDTQLIVDLHDTGDISQLFTASGYPKCGQYSLCCSPQELGDLGCGFPLFFDFLKMLFVLSASQCIFLSPVLFGVYNFWSHESSPSCSVYTLGLPKDAVDEDEIAQFFETNALPGNKEASIVKVVIGFDVCQYYEYAKRQSYLQKKLRRTGKPQDFHEQRMAWKDARAGAAIHQLKQARVRSIPTEIHVIAAALNQETEKHLREQLTRLEEKFKSLEAMHLRATGFAVVLFRYQLEQRECVRHWKESWQGCLKRLFGLGAFNSKHALFRDKYPLVVQRAPNPSDIQWENLAYSSSRRVLAKVATIGIGAVIWVVALTIDVVLLSLNVRIHNENYRGTGLEWFRPIENLIEKIDLSRIREALADPLDVQAHFGFLLLSFAPSVMTTLVNGAVGWVLDSMSQYERHQTVTGSEASSLLKLTVVFTLNTAVKYIFVLNQPEWWYVRGGMVESIFLKLLCCMLMEPIVTALPCQLATVLKSFALTVMYLPLAPIGVFLGLFMWSIYYWTYKYMLLRRCKRPYLQSALLPETALRLARFFMLCVPLVGAYLLVPSFDSSLHLTIQIVMLAGLGVALFFLVLPGRLAQKLFLTHFCQPEKEKTFWERMTYYQAQHMFVDKYHRTNPVYRALPAELNPEILFPPISLGLLGSTTAPEETPDLEGTVPHKRRRRGQLTNFGAAIDFPEKLQTQLRATIAATVDFSPGVARSPDNARFLRSLQEWSQGTDSGGGDPLEFLSSLLPSDIRSAVHRKTTVAGCLSPVAVADANPPGGPRGFLSFEGGVKEVVSLVERGTCSRSSPTLRDLRKPSASSEVRTRACFQVAAPVTEETMRGEAESACEAQTAHAQASDRGLESCGGGDDAHTARQAGREAAARRNKRRWDEGLEEGDARATESRRAGERNGEVEERGKIARKAKCVGTSPLNKTSPGSVTLPRSKGSRLFTREKAEGGRAVEVAIDTRREGSEDDDDVEGDDAGGARERLEASWPSPPPKETRGGGGAGKGTADDLESQSLFSPSLACPLVAASRDSPQCGRAGEAAHTEGSESGKENETNGSEVNTQIQVEAVFSVLVHNDEDPQNTGNTLQLGEMG
ncbi:hypothetical protein BESB_015880 [Besnoitia besnoiti]|uniref:DHHC zinc finger domain-containing protein n=1 Tax=Besnoitia besnoiti TaxID=94643 RepID=A0A2A9MA68_BESBE|nr:hypothetical protein BESB_015880 [Besnoitia besnoiti]PFH32270.1 hypothetical protein BESB_015880 [Besnoitia besnoiti]